MLAAERRVAGDVTAHGGERIVGVAGNSVEREICSLSGLSANAWCPTRRREWTAAERPLLPVQLASHVGRGVADGLAAGVSERWARCALRRARRASVQCEGARGAKGASVERALSIVSPAAGATYLIDPTLRSEFQTLVACEPVSATRGASNGVSMDARLDAADSDRKVEWPLSPGRQTIVARDEAGRTAAAHIVVR